MRAPSESAAGCTRQGRPFGPGLVGVGGRFGQPDRGRHLGRGHGCGGLGQPSYRPGGTPQKGGGRCVIYESCLEIRFLLLRC